MKHLKPEERAMLAKHPTWFLEQALAANVAFLNSLAERPEEACPEIGLHYVNGEWPAEFREMIAAIEDELRRRLEQLREGSKLIDEQRPGETP